MYLDMERQVDGATNRYPCHHPVIIKGFFLNMFLIPRQYEGKIKLCSCEESYQIGFSLFAPRAGEIYSSDTWSVDLLSADGGAVALVVHLEWPMTNALCWGTVSK